jgi:hypothetical protein
MGQLRVRSRLSVGIIEHWLGMKPETDAGHALLMQALKRLSKPVAKKHPLTARMLRGIFGQLDISQSGHQLVGPTVDWVLLPHVVVNS